MTVKELIELLAATPQSALVLVANGDDATSLVAVDRVQLLKVSRITGLAGEVYEQSFKLDAREAVEIT